MQRDVEAVLADLLDTYGDDPLLAAIPPEIEDKAGYLAALREMRPKLYQKARDYWRQVGDEARLALTDRELDEQFWLLDPEGIPRLKTDQDMVELPPDPLEGFVNLFADSDLTDLSRTVRESVAAYHRQRHERSD